MCTMHLKICAFLWTGIVRRPLVDNDVSIYNNNNVYFNVKRHFLKRVSIIDISITPDTLSRHIMTMVYKNRISLIQDNILIQMKK